MSTNPEPMLGAGILRDDVFVPLEEIEARVRRAGRGLAEAGVGPGDTIALLLRNDHEFFEASYAATSVGAASVPINWHGSADEVAYVVADSGAKLLVGHTDLLRGVQPFLPADLAIVQVPTPPEVAREMRIAPDQAEPLTGIETWAQWRDRFSPLEELSAAAATSMIYTSGTTGRPKGVRRLAATETPSIDYLSEFARHFGLFPGMRTVITGPMYHTAPNSYALISARAYSAFVAVQNRFDPEQLLQLIERHRITSLHMVPTMFIRLLRLPPEVRHRYDLSSLTHVVHAAAPCPIDVKHEMIDWLGPIIFEYYGGTEVGMVVGCDSAEWLAHPGTVGRPLPTVRIAIYGPDGPVPAGEVGEVYCRAESMPDFTYHGKEEARSQVGRDGLVSLGDVGFLDEDGYLYLSDRARDMVISGGVNIYPIEIEACILKIDHVADCAVFGIPDEEFGESLAAIVQLMPGSQLSAEQIRSHVAEHLARYKVPKVVEFHDELPRDDSGKIFKRRLREKFWEGTGRAI